MKLCESCNSGGLGKDCKAYYVYQASGECKEYKRGEEPKVTKNKLKCCDCGKPAVCWWPACDPDIPSYPFCRKCVEKRKRSLMLKLHELDEKEEVK